MKFYKSYIFFIKFFNHYLIFKMLADFYFAFEQNYQKLREEYDDIELYIRELESQSSRTTDVADHFAARANEVQWQRREEFLHGCAFFKQYYDDLVLTRTQVANTRIREITSIFLKLMETWARVDFRWMEIQAAPVLMEHDRNDLIRRLVAMFDLPQLNVELLSLFILFKKKKEEIIKDLELCEQHCTDAIGRFALETARAYRLEEH